jgi:hypothetical protein
MFTETGTGALTETPAATAVFTAVLTEGPLSRVSLARRLGLSAAAVTNRPLPFEEWARGAAVVSIQSLVAT